jgi:hypothetical protein
MQSILIVIAVLLLALWIVGSLMGALFHLLGWLFHIIPFLVIVLVVVAVAMRAMSRRG